MFNEKDLDTLYWTKLKRIKVKIKLPEPFIQPKFGNTKEGIANRNYVDKVLKEQELNDQKR